MKKLTKSLTVIIMCLLIAMSSVTFASAALERVTGLKVTALTYSTAKVTWNATSNAEGYQLQVNTNNTGWKNLSTNIKGTSFTVTGLAVGSTYSFRVRAYRTVKGFLGSTSTEYSEKYSTTVSITAKLAKVSNLKATTVSMTSVKLSWSKVSGATAYQIQKYVNKKWTTVANTKNLNYTVKSLKAGTTYSFRVRAYRTVSDVKKYGTASSTLKYTAGVGKVANVKISDSDYNSATLSWSKMSGVTGYQVYKYDYSNKSKGWYKVKTISSASTVKYTYGKLVTGTKYAFKVRAYYKTSSKTYYGSFCSNIYYTPKLETVTGLQLTKLSSTAATLTWNEVPGAEGYQVYDYATGKAVKLPTVKTEKAFISLKDGNVYKIKVRPYTKKSGSTVKGAFCDALVFYSAPAAVKNFDATVLDSGYAKFTWDAAEGAAGYNLYVKVGTFWKLIAGDITSTAYTLKDTAYLKDNTFMIRAYVQNGDTVIEGKDSAEYSLKVITAPTVTIGERTDTSIEFKWNALAGVNGYIIESYDYNSDKWNVIGESSQPVFTDYGFEERGMLVRVYGAILDKDGKVLSKGIPSEPVSATTSGITITQSNAVQTITWPKTENAAKYRVIIKNKDNYYSLPDTTVNSTTAVLTPETVTVLTICAYDKSNQVLGYVSEDIVFKTAPVTILPATHQNYDASVNSQLLYLVSAINNSKTETDKVTVSSTSSVSYSTDKFYLTTGFGTSEFKGDDIQGLLNTIGNITAEDKKDLEELALSNTETIRESLDFSGGIAKNSQGQTVRLAAFVEPSNKTFTSLYDWENPSAWRNGFTGVKTAALANGGYRFEITLKQEKFGTSVGRTNPLYHPCFTTTVASLGYLSGSDQNLENELSTVGDTVITATVNADGTLDDYTINSPYTMKINYKVNNPLVSSFGMYMTGSIISEYSFTR
ncbi:MAG: fibronectin type III domain-containing protein [Clostridia bacterium]|nr:fibronectin type III domain-containing protein [Clostridia bacterium]